jgi:hypothetical protein
LGYNLRIHGRTILQSRSLSSPSHGRLRFMRSLL